MNASLLQLMAWEWRRLRAERLSLVLIAVWIGLLATAAWQGATHTCARHAEIVAAQSADEAAWQEKRARLIAVEAGREEPQPFRDPRSPTHNVLSSPSDRPVALVPARLAALAVDASELAPAVKRAGTLTKVHMPPDSLENPANRLAGRLDLLFVVGALMPLFVLALAFDVLARERELQIWPLLASQPVRPGRVVASRLTLHFMLIWLPLAVAATAAVMAAQPAGSGWLPACGELLVWLGLAAAYLLFWQALAAALNFRGGSAAANALALCGAWLACVLLAPLTVEIAVQGTRPAPDRLGLILAERDSDIALHKRADRMREEFYARHGYEPPRTALNEYDTFFVGNIVPRAFATSEAIAPALGEIERRREAQARRAGQLAWLSPSLAFQRASELLAGVTAEQQDALVQHAREFQRRWRSHFGAKLASMSPLTLADYDNKPQPPAVQQAFRERAAMAASAVVSVAAWAGLLAITALHGARRFALPA